MGHIKTRWISSRGLCSFCHAPGHRGLGSPLCGSRPDFVFLWHSIVRMESLAGDVFSRSAVSRDFTHPSTADHDLGFDFGPTPE